MEIILENQSALVKRKYLKGHRLERNVAKVPFEVKDGKSRYKILRDFYPTENIFRLGEYLFTLADLYAAVREQMGSETLRRRNAVINLKNELNSYTLVCRLRKRFYKFQDVTVLRDFYRVQGSGEERRRKIQLGAKIRKTRREPGRSSGAFRSISDLVRRRGLKDAKDCEWGGRKNL
ncbi:hypothetical protein HZH66_002213 [Vespula vulgaris]|uniref:Uncharacterized protein n=1 Tax=Vespula vulgaris TaxID=7454 RepID=A0A834KIZ8_VESVU|nr:hypothetical protein HZH66_002213 [Vespula vulgaris]